MIPAREDSSSARSHPSLSGGHVVLARRENLLAETKRFAPRPALAERALCRAPAAGPVEIEPSPAALPSPSALPLPAAPEPLVMRPDPKSEAIPDRSPKAEPGPSHPLPRNRALVAPPTGLVGRLVTWFSASTRRLWHGAPSKVPATAKRTNDGARPDPLSVALLRAELRELRAELAVARRVAERREVLLQARAREAAR